MNSIIRWPTVCMRCGSLDHMAKDCDMVQKFGLSDQERDYAAEARRDKQAVIATAVVLVLAQFVIAALCGVTP